MLLCKGEILKREREREKIHLGLPGTPVEARQAPAAVSYIMYCGIACGSIRRVLPTALPLLMEARSSMGLTCACSGRERALEGSRHSSSAVRAISPLWLDEHALYTRPVSVGHASLGQCGFYRAQDRRQGVRRRRSSTKFSKVFEFIGPDLGGIYRAGIASGLMAP